jgi:hypothetical protein
LAREQPVLVGHLERLEALVIWLVTAASLIVVVVTVLIHYELLSILDRMTPTLSIPVRSRMLLVIAAVLAAHLVEISLYAGAFFIMQHHLGLGSIEGAMDGSALDFFYFSVTTYTTLGIGDLSPRGPLRILSGLESLTGLVLIGWSASFTYIAMQKLWEHHRTSAEETDYADRA